MRKLRDNIKWIFFISILFLSFIDCRSQTENKSDKTSAVLLMGDEDVKLQKLRKLFVVGDFEGNGKIDTIFEHNFSRATNMEIDSSANPYQHEWGDVINWFYEQDAESYLTINKPNKDTLHLGTGQGLYCLINIGDNNSDSKDEIALVKDRLDYSRLNYCEIYTLCNEKWTLLKEFAIFEGAFDFYEDEYPLFLEIKEYLEKHNGKWLYLDYLDEKWDAFEEVGKMKPLKLEKCK